ncbi:hypothetical protein ACFWOJ_21155 [Streptomyces sp. NPDC058439]|uniref:hypothetical protein n=1 Tax=Streptomyces sp. NPDC058439 TaxID=3346500 RepID=UPI00364916C8
MTGMATRCLCPARHGEADAVILHSPGRPASILIRNDMGHLTDELRWTALSPGLRP